MMKKAPILYAITLFLSSFLLFFIQPLFAKMSLPLLGGTAIVWNCAMVFFQGFLLLGYVYSHKITNKFSIKKQVIFQFILFALALFFLPFSIKENISSPEKYQVFWLLGFFIVNIGLVFFCVSTVTPLLQRWFSYTFFKEAQDPYYLYSYSSIAGISALILYPTVIEPNLKIKEQALLWLGLYVCLLLLVLMCGYFSIKNQKPEKKEKEEKQYLNVGLKTKVKWIFLSFIPSSLFLSVSSIITTDVAPMPLLWVLPLVVYQFCFFVCFYKKELLSYETIKKLASFVVLIFLFFYFGKKPLLVEVSSYLILLFFVCLVTIKKLHLERPQNKNLTDFYLCLSIGGVLGGVFNTLIAPVIFNDYYEFIIVLFLSIFSISSKYKLRTEIILYFEKLKKIKKILILTVVFVGFLYLVNGFKESGEFSSYALLLAGGYILIISFNYPKIFKFLMVFLFLTVSFFYEKQNFEEFEIVKKQRSHFAKYAIAESKDDSFYALLHGNTIHGGQNKTKNLKYEAVTYYGKQSSVGDIMTVLEEFDFNDIGVVGLGVGTISSYCDDGENWSFYEIDPNIVKIAKNKKYFSFLERCKDNVKIILGDARLSLKKEEDGKFDILFIDAFNSDSIPYHLLTKQAFELYLKKLRKNGIVMFNISNRYLDLKKVIAGLAKEYGLKGYYKVDDRWRLSKETNWVGSSNWAFISKNKNLAYLISRSFELWDSLSSVDEKVLFTDDFSNILSVLN